jgi:Alpha/beta hydrolase family
MQVLKTLERAALIRPEERDSNLKLQSPKWGAGLRRWTLHTGLERHFSRQISVHKGEDGPTRLHEMIAPFPSAPIYGINRKTEYGKELQHRPNMHTVRILKRPDGAPIHRLFLLHNGLNETDSMKFYYRLADWIFSQQELVEPDAGAACLIMPFPGHLTHSSWHGPFSETPLARYLADAGDLFRQFLRYMVEMRWLLSLIADSDAAPWMVGGDLLPQRSRADKLFKESERLYEMSKKRVATANKVYESQTGIATELVDIGEKTELAQIENSEQILRSTLGRDLAATPDALRVHVVGYSLGGFLAQSVFFTWPQVVSSCTTICSGGALSSLSPTAFAQPEEWQSVLHALRPELSNSMMQGRLGDDEGSKKKPVDMVAGMPLQRFGYFQRIFEQVFLQEDRGSYKERLSEYGLRMLFVSGGEDPIVPPANILDASPKEGTTMLSVAGMTHFLNQEPKDDRNRREGEQREFWLPEAGGLIARAAIHSEQVHRAERQTAKKWRRKSPETPAPGSSVRPPRGSDLLERSDTFEAALDWVVDATSEDDGWLIICRNTLPAALIGDTEFTRWGTALHHHDVRVQQYAAGLRRRVATLEERRDRLTVIVPEQLRRWFVDLSPRFDPHSDGPAGRMTTKADRLRIWRDFQGNWWQSIREFRAGNIGEPYTEGALEVASFATAVAKAEEVDSRYIEVTQLPDVWIGLKKGGQLFSPNAKYRAELPRELIEGVERALRDRETLIGDIETEHIRVVQVSGAEFNPRYRGKIETSPGAVLRLLERCAAGVVRSGQMPEPEG